jgi:hypothetical protein
MPGPAAAGVAGSVAQGVIGSRSAKKAGQAQQAAANAQIEESRRQFDTIQGLLRPYVSAGNVALQAQLDLMGIGGGGGTSPAIEAFAIGGTPGTGPQAASLQTMMNGMMGIPNAQGTPGTAGGTQYRVNGQTFGTLEEAQAFANANRTGGMSAADAQRAAIDRLANGENFRALQAQGEYGLMANAAATGGLRGGNTQAALAQFRPQMLQSLIDRQLANLGGVAANGQTAAGNVGIAATNTAGMVNQALGDQGAAAAGIAKAQGQAWQNAGSGVLNTLGMNFN